MELEVSNNVTKEKQGNSKTNEFLKDLEKSLKDDNKKGKSTDIDANQSMKKPQQEVNEKEIKKITTKDIKMDEISNLSTANNIAKNNKMTIENRKEFLQQESQSLFDIYDKNEQAGALYYISGKGPNNDLYVFKVNPKVDEESFEMMQKTEFPENAKVGEIYRKKKNGEIYLSEDDTRAHNRKMKSVAKGILNKQEQDGGYKREFTKNDLVVGKGYEGGYFEHPLYVNEKLGKEAGLPLSMIQNFLGNDINEVFENVASKLSEKGTICTVLPKNRSKIYEFTNGQIKEKDFASTTSDLWYKFGQILKEDKSGELVEDESTTKLFQKEILKELKSKIKVKYDNICNDYKKEGHIYNVEKALDENFDPTITLKDISQNRFFKLEDLDFIENRYAGDGIYTVKNGEYCKVDIKEKIPKNHTVDKEKEDGRNFANIMSKKYNIPKEEIENKMKEFIIEKSKEEGAIAYTGYDKAKDEYYIDYYIEGSFEKRDIISKEDADEMEVGTFVTMGTDEFNNYSEFFDANNLRRELEEIIKKSK